METRIVIVFIFTMIIHLISTLSYSVRLVGIKTGRISVSAALFNVFALGSRFSNALQAPFMAKLVEDDLPHITTSDIYLYFIIILSAAGLGTLLGGLFTPTFQRIFTEFVNRFDVDSSVPKLKYRSVHNFGLYQLKRNLKAPSKENFRHIKDFKAMPRRRIVLNVLAVAMLTVGSFAALYAAALEPSMRLKVSSLVPIITGFATLALVAFIDPYFSLLTDDIINGKKNIAVFYKAVVWLVSSRFIGTLLALLILEPAARLIIFVATLL